MVVVCAAAQQFQIAVEIAFQCGDIQGVEARPRLLTPPPARAQQAMAALRPGFPPRCAASGEDRCAPAFHRLAQHSFVVRQLRRFALLAKTAKPHVWIST